MHVLMLPSWYPESLDDINGIFFREQAEALVAQGFTVGVLAVDGISINHPTARSRAAMSRVTHSIERGVTVMRARALRPVPLAHRMNARSIVRRWQTVFREYVSAHGMPDVLHAHTIRPGGLAAREIARETGLPYLITEHRPESAVADSKNSSLRSMLLESQTEAQDLIAVSPGFAESLNRAYKIQRWRSLPNLLPPQFEAAGIVEPNGTFVFGHVSNLDPVKRVDLLIAAFHQAFAGSVDVQLRIAGNSVQRGALEQQVRALGVTNITFVGNLSRAHIVDEFSRYDAFVLPSSVESFGVVLWEAMACGVPIIASDTDGGRLAVVEESGYLVPRDDEDALAASLLKMRAKHASFDRQMIRDRAVGFCGVDAFVQNYREAYARAASARCGD